MTPAKRLLSNPPAPPGRTGSCTGRLLVVLACLAAACVSARPRRDPGVLTQGQQGLATPPWTELWIVRSEDLAASRAPLEPAFVAGRTSWGPRMAPRFQRLDARARVLGRLASVTLRQGFANQSDEDLDLEYELPLPREAAVTDFLVKIGERSIRGVVAERAEAEELFHAARAQGLLAVLLSPKGPGRFTQRLGSLAPGESLEVETTYVHALPYDAGTGECELRFPRAQGQGPYEATYALELSTDVELGDVQVLGLEGAPATTEGGSASWSATLQASGRSPDVRVRYRLGGAGWRGEVLGAVDPDGGSRLLLLAYPPADVQGILRPVELEWDAEVEATGPPVSDRVPATPWALGLRVAAGVEPPTAASALVEDSSGLHTLTLPVRWHTGDDARLLLTTWARMELGELAVLAHAASGERLTMLEDEARTIALDHGLSSFLTSHVLVDAASGD